MGQVHPQGPHVVGLIQHGAGKNCDCGPPRFDKLYDPRFGALGISQQDFDGKLDQTNRVLKENTPNLPVVLGAFLFVVIAPYILRGVLPSAQGCDESNDGHFLCNHANATKPDSTLVWPEEQWPDHRNDKRNCGDAEEMVDSYCSRDEDPDCYRHIVRTCCEGDFDDADEMADDKCGGGFLLQMIFQLLPALFVVLLIVRFCNARRIVNRKIQELFRDWTTKGIGVVYSPASKHAPGRLSFILPTGMANRQPMMAPMMVVGQVQSVRQPLQNQQMGQVQMVPMQNQQMGQVQMMPMQATSVVVVQPNSVGYGGAGGVVAVQPIQPLMATTPMPVQNGMLQQQPTLVPTPVPIPVA